jgi:hypothetical protein
LMHTLRISDHKFLMMNAHAVSEGSGFLHNEDCKFGEEFKFCIKKTVTNTELIGLTLGIMAG